MKDEANWGSWGRGGGYGIRDPSSLGMGDLGGVGVGPSRITSLQMVNHTKSRVKLVPKLTPLLQHSYYQARCRGVPLAKIPSILTGKGWLRHKQACKKKKALKTLLTDASPMLPSQRQRQPSLGAHHCSGEVTLATCNLWGQRGGRSKIHPS